MFNLGNKARSIDDFPTFERPTNAISGCFSPSGYIGYLSSVLQTLILKSVEENI